MHDDFSSRPRACFRPHFSLRNSARALAMLSSLGLPGWALAGGGDWVEFVEETSTRIVSDPSVGISDTQEKDMTTGDVDNDGDVDLVIVRKVPFSNPGGRRNVLFMNESGVMVDRTSTLAPDFLDITDDRDVVLVDLDDDGWLDIVTAGTFGEASRILMNLGEDGGGQWLGFDYEPARLPTFSPTGNFCSVSAGDVTGDDMPDLYFSDYDSNVEDRLLINSGSGMFSDQTSSRMTAAMTISTFSTDSAIADMNGDTFNDIVKDNASGSTPSFPPPGPTGPTVSVSYNDGTGHFSVRDDIYTLDPYMTAIADFTQDGKLDMFVVDDVQDRYLINTGNGPDGFADFSIHTVANSPATFGFGGEVQLHDLDGDGILDALVSDVDTDLSGCDRRLGVLRGTGTPPNITYSDPFGGANRPWLTQGTFNVAVFDINNDHAVDLWIGTCSGTRVFMGISPLLFEDGFEAGNTSAWSSSVP